MYIIGEIIPKIALATIPILWLHWLLHPTHIPKQYFLGSLRFIIAIITLAIYTSVTLLYYTTFPEPWSTTGLHVMLKVGASIPVLFVTIHEVIASFTSIRIPFCDTQTLYAFGIWGYCCIYPEISHIWDLIRDHGIYDILKFL